MPSRNACHEIAGLHSPRSLSTSLGLAWEALLGVLAGASECPWCFRPGLLLRCRRSAPIFGGRPAVSPYARALLCRHLARLTSIFCSHPRVSRACPLFFPFFFSLLVMSGVFLVLLLYGQRESLEDGRLYTSEKSGELTG